MRDDEKKGAPEESEESPAPPREDVGPDPVWGLGVFVVGLVVMAVGGAKTWHWVFNVGETLLLLGAIVFLVCVTMTAMKQQPIEWRKTLRKVFARDKSGDDE